MTSRKPLWITLAAVLALAVVLAISLSRRQPPATPTKVEDLATLVLTGRTAFENADAPTAITAFQKALALDPTKADLYLNLANALLLAGQNEQAIAAAQKVLELEKNSAAALYLIGCAQLRQGKAAEALQALQQSEFIEADVSAVHFQIARAHQMLSRWEDAAAAFSAAINLEPEHPAAHYALSQVLVRLAQPKAAQEELERHRQIIARRPGLPNDPTYFEKSKHTQARLPAVAAEQPAAAGIPVIFADVTAAMLGKAAGKVRGPIAFIDLRRDGQLSALVVEGEGFRLLENQGGKFQPRGELLPGKFGAPPSGGPLPSKGGTPNRALVGDLNNDQLDDVLVLGDRGAKVFALGKDGNFTDVTEASGLRELTARGGVLADLDFTGKLGLIATSDTGLTFFRNQGGLIFRALPPGSAIPAATTGVRQLAVDDWNGDDLPDLFVGGASEAPQLWLNQHGGPMKAASAGAARLNPATDVRKPPVENSEPWPNGSVFAVGDVNGDLRNDLAVVTGSTIEVAFGGLPQRVSVPIGDFAISHLALLDYDNDGWLDLLGAGQGLRIWRNLVQVGFRETTAELALDKLSSGAIAAVTSADFDADGDPDLLLDRGESGLQLLRNDGGNANRQLQLRLIGKRSNASGIGARVEVISGGWRASRTAHSRALAIGIGQRSRIDSLAMHWADLVMNLGAVTVDPKTPLEVTELELPTGSCPYLYVWDGTRFRFVTDLLGASPAGLRISDDRFIEADTDELIHVGDESSVQPRDGHYVFQFTDELREVIYLDQAQFVVADHPAGTELFSTSKLRPGKPFVPHELVLLSQRRPLMQATHSDGTEVTATLAEKDGAVISPSKLRGSQLRGLAEPFAVTLDFGALPVERPLVLALTGWLYFGGGMANVAASHDPTLPFPFPTLEVETADGKWQPVEVVCGAPAGKTKSIIIDLAGKLPPGARRLRLSTAFEIHWDRIALFEHDARPVRSVALAPATADLHWHGSGKYEAQPWTVPRTPIHDQLQPVAPWLITPSGWCTRYGDVRELVDRRDDALVIMNCGDEVTLSFPAAQLPAKAPGDQREFFLFTSGWDKDGDYHVEHGLTVEPIPFQGMDDQLYGRQPRPVIEGDWWIPKYNTRWVGPLTLRKESRFTDR